MLECIRRLFGFDRTLAEAASLSARELADLGVSREQALNLAAMPCDVADRVGAMARVFAIRKGALPHNRTEWLELIETCNSCASLPECRQFLALGPAARPEAAAFCPNRKTFERHRQHA